MMTVFSRPRTRGMQSSRPMTTSDNSHSSESAVSQRGSNYSSNTSSGTHFPWAASNIPPLPPGAKPPQVSLPTIDCNVSSSPKAKRKTRLLRKPHPPSSITNLSTRYGNLFYTADLGPPPGSAQVRANSDGNTSFHGTNAVHRQSRPTDGVASTSSYGVSRHAHSSFENHSSHAFGRSMPPAEQANHTSNAMTYLIETLDMPSDKPALVEETVHSDTLVQGSSRGHISPVVQPRIVGRDKPLPAPPVLWPLAAPEPRDSLPSHTLSYQQPARALSSHEGQGVPLLEQFIAVPNVNKSSGHEFGLYSDVGRPQTWSDSGHATSVTHHAHSEVLSHVSEFPFHRNPEPRDVRSHNYLRPLSTQSHPTSSFYQPSTPLFPATCPTRSAALYTSQPPVRHPQGTRALTHRLSLGKRIKQSLFTALFRKNSTTDRPIKGVLHPESETGDGTMLHRPAGQERLLTPLNQNDPQDIRPLRTSRKLRKRTPSLAQSLMTSAPILKSNSTPALRGYKSGPGDHFFETDDAPSQDMHPEFDATPEPRPNKRRSTSNPTGYAMNRSSSPVAPYSGPDAGVPILTVRETQSQPTTPTSVSGRKLAKRQARRKTKERSVDEHSTSVLPSLRTQSPFNLDFEPPRISDASRSYSAPLLGASDLHSEHVLASRYLTFATKSSESHHFIESPGGEHSWSEQHHSRPPQPQDSPSILHSRLNRRWTLAVFDASEEQVVEELDRLRDVGWGPGFQGELVRVKGKAVTTMNQEQDTGASLEKDELEKWLIARKALMVCREIARTEKSYREGLVRLQRGETLKPPPPLLMQYIPALVSASQAFSARLDEDPSAWGVSAAFLGAEDALEGALVAWSGVVGEFFGSAGQQRKHWDHKLLQKDRKGKEKEKDNKVTGAPVLPPVTYSDLGHGHEHTSHAEMDSVLKNWRESMPTLSQLLPSSTDIRTDTSHVHRKSWYSSRLTVSNAAKMPTVQDLAIQPTQRVVRYVLLYKDLLNSTPAVSPARALVERALEGANRIAQRCNRAQDNAAFLT